LPLLVIYELAAFALAGDAVSGVRNGADVLLKSLFLTLGGRQGLLLFNALLLGGFVVFVWRDMRQSGGRLVPGVFGGMMAESVVGGLVFGVVAGSITAILLGGIPHLALAQMSSLSLPTQLTISLGAGIYEELLFRVLLVGALVLLARRFFGWKPLAAGIFATAAGAFLFSAFHYIGPYGDPLELGSFMFRFVAGLLFSGMYLLRGLGITAWTHALYDVFLTVMLAGR
jgi:hypothetical protein